MGNSTELKDGQGPFNLGNSLVEIAALTSLIGSTAAESLALGDKGPAGLVWAMMTVFGAMPVVKQFIATATPGWLRESMGVRSSRSDAVVGLSLDLNKAFKFQARGDPAIAVECEIKNVQGEKIKDPPVDFKHRCVYVFSQHTTNILNCISSSLPGEDLKVYTFVQDPWHNKTASYNYWLDWTLLLLSMIAKFTEFIILWRYAAWILAWVTISTWLFFFSATLLLQLHELRRRALEPEIDIITGSLPTCSTAGGERKVLLGIPKSPRLHMIWRVIWGLGAVVGIATVVASYLALGHSTSSEVFFVWTGFQVLWLGLRSTLFYLLSNREGKYHVGLEGKPWAKVNTQERARLRRLVFALSRYQIHQHPRLPLSYVGDVDTLDTLDNVQSEYPLSSDDKDVIISVHGVIPDTILASLSWVFGSKKGGFDFYDTSIIILNTPDGPSSIPAARALSTQPVQETLDSEQGADLAHLPRGGLLPQGNQASFDSDINMKWCYWVPCSEGRWLYFSTERTKNKGLRNAVVLSDLQVTDMLNDGKVFISLKHVDEVKEIVENSRLACGHLVELLR